MEIRRRREVELDVKSFGERVVTVTTQSSSPNFHFDLSDPSKAVIMQKELNLLDLYERLPEYLGFTYDLRYDHSLGHIVSSDQSINIPISDAYADYQRSRGLSLDKVLDYFASSLRLAMESDGEHLRSGAFPRLWPYLRNTKEYRSINSFLKGKDISLPGKRLPGGLTVELGIKHGGGYAPLALGAFEGSRVPFDDALSLSVFGLLLEDNSATFENDGVMRGVYTGRFSDGCDAVRMLSAPLVQSVHPGRRLVCFVPSRSTLIISDDDPYALVFAAHKARMLLFLKNGVDALTGAAFTHCGDSIAEYLPDPASPAFEVMNAMKSMN